MMKILLLISIVFASRTLSSQSEIIELSQFYEGKGVIFNESYKNKAGFHPSDKAFTPTFSDIKIFEETLRFFSPRPKEIKRDYYRQYLGYIINNEKYLIVYLMNFKNKRAASKIYFKEWDKEFSLGLGEYYEKNGILLKFNLQDKMIGVY